MSESCLREQVVSKTSSSLPLPPFQNVPLASSSYSSSSSFARQPPLFFPPHPLRHLPRVLFAVSNFDLHLFTYPPFLLCRFQKKCFSHITFSSWFLLPSFFSLKPHFFLSSHPLRPSYPTHSSPRIFSPVSPLLPSLRLFLLSNILLSSACRKLVGQAPSKYSSPESR